MNFQWFNQAESETGFWFCSEPVNNSVQCPVSSFSSVASNTCVQSPGIPVCWFKWSHEADQNRPKRFKKRWGCCAFLNFSFWFSGSKLITPMKIDHQKFLRTVELNVQGTICVQKRVPFPQKRFFWTQLNGYSSKFLEVGDKLSLKVGKFLDFVITISKESFPLKKGNMSKKNFYKFL